MNLTIFVVGCLSVILTTVRADVTQDDPSVTSPYERTTLSNVEDAAAEVLTSEETTGHESLETEHKFALPDNADHCARYKRMINLVRKVHVRLGRMDKRSARVIEMLINEILMEADMENYSSLLELHKVCHDSIRHRSHHHGSTTTTTQQTSTDQNPSVLQPQSS